MPTCPNCHTQQTKRKGGACPECGVEVQLYKGEWYRASIGSPTVAILHRFERLVSDQLSAGRQTRVVFTVPPKHYTYPIELKTAERLLSTADNDIDLVFEAFDVLFTDTRFNWKKRQSLRHLSTDFLTALALALANRQDKEKLKDKERRTVSAVLDREDIFA